MRLFIRVIVQEPGFNGFAVRKEEIIHKIRLGGRIMPEFGHEGVHQAPGGPHANADSATFTLSQLREEELQRISIHWVDRTVEIFMRYVRFDCGSARRRVKQKVLGKVTVGIEGELLIGGYCLVRGPRCGVCFAEEQEDKGDGGALQSGHRDIMRFFPS
mmetsp:Transcript_12232/g.24413  ORF Transcript_12232/g.24413 Transcript_12232/m.24413 type:complete len:159 (-) Transcript_12232:53-529(-)